MPSFYEFFAGGGMARAGLGPRWECLFANDIDAKKGDSYSRNWGAEHLRIGDIGVLTAADLPGRADLAWASFPCQDLSLAGGYAGLKGERSGTFWGFWRLMKSLAGGGRAPAVIVLENVCGALTSHGGRDFAAIGDALVSGGYRFGAVVMDAALFVPQSRPRLFIVALREETPMPPVLAGPVTRTVWRPSHLASAYERLPERLKAAWLWWNIPDPPHRGTTFADLIEDDPVGVAWHTPAETMRLLDMMSPLNLEKVEKAGWMGRRMVGAVYKRTRTGRDGVRRQRAEIRFDDLAGCLRTPAGGSSRQTIMIIEKDSVRSRLLSPREAARLMGLPDSYLLPKNYNEAYHLLGDGVVVPVIRHLAQHLLEPLLSAGAKDGREAA